MGVVHNLRNIYAATPRMLMKQPKLLCKQAALLWSKRQRHVWIDNPRPRKTPIEKKLERIPCYQVIRRTERKCWHGHRNLMDEDHYVIDLEKCHPNRCIGLPPPRDKTLYKPSDKATRVYQQTWNECIPLGPVVQQCCSYEPSLSWRPIGVSMYARQKSSAACPQDDGVKMKNVCETKIKSLETTNVPKGNPRCPSIRSRCCKQRRFGDCKEKPGPSGCMRRLTAYPSYSECRKPPGIYEPPTECHCLERMPLCEAWAQWNKQQHNMRHK